MQGEMYPSELLKLLELTQVKQYNANQRFRTVTKKLP
jgi:hypothetical protein